MGNALPDYYAMLRVSECATEREIKSAFRTRAKQCHPDAGGTHDLMIQLIAAYEVLSDAQQRAEYDRLRRESDSAQAKKTAYQRAEKAAKETYASHGDSWEELVNWIDQRSAAIQAEPNGRMAAGGVGGFILGLAIGSLFGAWLGAGWMAGALVGAACGGLAGAMTANSKEVSNQKGGPIS